MFKSNKIIGITGKTCSGKTTLLNILKNGKDCIVIELDALIRDNFFYEGRITIIENKGLKALEDIIFPKITQMIMESLDNVFNKTIFIEGVKLNELCINYDFIIELEIPYEQRLANSISKGWTKEKFEFIDALFENNGKLKVVEKKIRKSIDEATMEEWNASHIGSWGNFLQEKLDKMQ